MSQCGPDTARQCYGCVDKVSEFQNFLSASLLLGGPPLDVLLVKDAAQLTAHVVRSRRGTIVPLQVYHWEKERVCQNSQRFM